MNSVVLINVNEVVNGYSWRSDHYNLLLTLQAVNLLGFGAATQLASPANQNVTLCVPPEGPKETAMFCSQAEA